MQNFDRYTVQSLKDWDQYQAAIRALKHHAK